MSNFCQFYQLLRLNQIENNSHGISIPETKESNTFYKALTYSLIHLRPIPNNSIHYTTSCGRHFKNQTLIPNHLKRNSLDRSMVIQQMPTRRSTTLSAIIGEEAKSEYDYALIHIPNMHMAFVTKHDERTVEICLKAFCTYHLTPEELSRTLIKTYVSPVIFAIELILKQTANPYLKGDVWERIPIEKDIWSQALSFTLTPIYDEQQQVIFLATRFASSNNGIAHLISITILDYTGKSIFTTLSCPREQITNYHTERTGLTDKMLRGKPDIYSVFKKATFLLKGRIIVGYKVWKQIMRLRMDPRDIRGIRDLSTAPASTLRVQEIKKMRAFTTVIEEGILLYRLYMERLTNWTHDVEPWKEDLAKIPWDIVHGMSNFSEELPPSLNSLTTSPINELPNNNSDLAVESEDEIWLDPITDDFF